MRTRKEGGCYIMLANTITVISARIQMSTQHTYPFCRYPFLHPNVTNRHDATASKLCTFTDAVNMALQQCALYLILSWPNCSGKDTRFCLAHTCHSNCASFSPYQLHLWCIASNISNCIGCNWKYPQIHVAQDVLSIQSEELQQFVSYQCNTTIKIW